jgi:hypothetical protein
MGTKARRTSKIVVLEFAAGQVRKILALARWQRIATPA